MMNVFHQNVVPIHKKDDYSPVSLLSICARIFERIIYNRIFEYLIKNNLIHIVKLTLPPHIINKL